MTRPRPRRGARGQAVLEVLVCAPLLVLAGLLAWWCVAALWAGLRAEEAARRAALDATGGRGVLTVERVATVPGPLARDLTVTVRARVLAP